MEFRTSRFGKVSVDDEAIINVHQGLLGFPDATRYVVLEHDREDTPFKWLQAVDNPNLAFVIIDPLEIVENYPVCLDEDLVEMTGSSDLTEYGAMVIVNIPCENPSGMTANLRAPILVHMKNRIAKQTILEDDTMPLNYRIIPETSGKEDQIREEVEL